MRFDIIVGNPPYQEDKEKETSYAPMYQKFLDVSRRVGNRYISFIIPARWYAGGKGLDNFRAHMLNCGHLKSIVDYPNSYDIFTSVKIAGGLMYFLYDMEYVGECAVTNVFKGERITMVRNLQDEGSDFIRYNKAVSIVKKVAQHNEISIAQYACFGNVFGFETNETGDCEIDDPKAKYRLVTSSGDMGLTALRRGNELVDKYKLIVGKINPDSAIARDHLGAKVLTQLRILEPGELVTNSYLMFGPFETKYQAESFRSLLATKLARFLIWQKVTSVHINESNIKMVPLQPLDRIHTDKDLYEKYGLTDGEIEYVEETIRSSKDWENFNKFSE